jgi:diguanylate cyclase (GGDEF)-like protein
MRFIRGLFWLLLAASIVTAALYVTERYELADRLTGLFLAAQSWLPLAFSFEHFLVALTVVCLLLVVLTLSVGAVFVILLTVRSQRKLGQAASVRLEIDHLKEEHQRQFDQLLSLEALLTKRLDKRVLVQTIIETASRITSVAQANSIVSFWLFNFETDTLRFERGLYCDETMFTQTEFQLTESPFGRVILTQQPLLLSSWDEGTTLVKREKAPRLGAATSAIVVPLVIESSVLGVLMVFCQPEVLKRYEERKAFYDATWGALAMALAIAIQGEVAILDRLTGVHNRDYFMKRLIQEIERANRYQQPLSLLMVDIDDFKLVNDMLGHPQGDAVLKIIAKLIKKSVRAIDLVGRYGGEEFIVMLPETGHSTETLSSSGAPLVAERIRKAVDDEFRGLQKPLNLTVSVGVACRRFPEDREADYRDLVRVADEQLYRAKTSGKNKVCVLMPERPQEVA